MWVLRDQFDCADWGNLKLLKESLTTTNVNDTADHGITVLWLAAKGGYLGCVQHILEMGANVNQQLDAGQTALHAAAVNSHCDTVLALLEAGADPNIRNGMDQIPMYLCKSSEVAQILIDYGCTEYRTRVGDVAFLKFRRDSRRNTAIIVCAMRVKGMDRNIMRLVAKQIWSARFWVPK